MGKLLSRSLAFPKGPYDRLIALVAYEIDFFGQFNPAGTAWCIYP